LEQKRSYSGCPGVSACNTVPASSRHVLDKAIRRQGVHGLSTLMTVVQLTCVCKNDAILATLMAVTRWHLYNYYPNANPNPKP